MAIVYPLNPSLPKIRSVEFTAFDAIASSRSEFTKQPLVAAHQGQYWEMVVSSAPMKRDDAEEWITFLLSAKGRFGNFYFGDPFNTTPRGVATGTPQIDGAAETGEDINTKGWTASVTNIIRKGDWVQLGAGSILTLHKSLTDVNSDGSGNATLTLWPKVVTAFADSTAITVNSAQGRWRLMVNERAFRPQPNGVYQFSFAASQDR